MIEHITNITAAMIAVFLSFHSSDFLLQYSFDQLAPHIPNQIHPFGDIRTIDHIKIIQDKIIKTINIVAIIFCSTKINISSCYDNNLV